MGRVLSPASDAGPPQPVGAQGRVETSHVEWSPTLDKRFWAKVKKAGPEECWEWVAGRTSAGYGNFQPRQRGIRFQLLAHRVSYALATGIWPGTRQEVCHRCDRPACVNPAHLFLGSHQDNMSDKVAKNRQSKGLRHSLSSGRAVHAPVEVQLIRCRLMAGWPQHTIARHHGVSSAYVWKIAHNVIWSALPWPSTDALSEAAA